MSLPQPRAAPLAASDARAVFPGWALPVRGKGFFMLRLSARNIYPDFVLICLQFFKVPSVSLIPASVSKHTELKVLLPTFSAS